MDEAPAPVDDGAVEETFDEAVEITKPAEKIEENVEKPAEVPAPEPVEVEQQNDSPPTPVAPRSEPSAPSSTTGVIKPPEPPKEPPKPAPPAPTPVPVAAPAVFDVNALTDDQLKAAAALWAKRSQQTFSALGVAKRKESMELNLRAIVDYLSHHNGSPLPRIARHVNVTPGTTSKYLVQLTKSEKVRA